MKQRHKVTKRTRDRNANHTLVGGPNLLEQFHNTVTKPENEHGVRYEIAKCGCRSWFCPECCSMMGYNLRARLIPLVSDFKGLMMVTFTVDPTLFADPRTAYLYTMDNRCISVTSQDLDRANFLFTRSYFYVVEWQKTTEQAHYHVLYDSKYIAWSVLLESWSKHRPSGAGPILGERPAFGTVHFDAPEFAGPVHAARYATKYLTKYPKHGFPNWVLDMGKERRIRRYGVSHGFWGTTSRRSRPSERKRVNSRKTYRERTATCGDSINVFEMNEFLDRETGEILTKPVWMGQMDVDASVIDSLYDPGNPKRRRRSLLAVSSRQIKQIVEAASGQKAQWKRRRASRV